MNEQKKIYMRQHSNKTQPKSPCEQFIKVHCDEAQPIGRVTVLINAFSL